MIRQSHVDSYLCSILSKGRSHHIGNFAIYGWGPVLVELTGVFWFGYWEHTVGNITVGQFCRAQPQL